MERTETDPRTDWITAATATLRKHSFVSGVWLIGSFARGTADAYSDIDLVVSVDADMPAHGPDAEAVASRLCDAIRAWDRHAPNPHVAVYRSGTQPDPADPDGSGGGGTRLSVPRRHTTIAVTWPAPAPTLVRTS